jgi:hypothetical protein
MTSTIRLAEDEKAVMDWEIEVIDPKTMFTDSAHKQRFVNERIT